MTVLCYHDPSSRTLSRHLEFLSRRFELVSLNHLLEHDWPKKQDKSWVVITLDDGHAGNYQLVPAFRRYGIKPTIYICTGIVNTRRRFWWQAVPSAQARRELMRLPDGERKARLREDYGFSEKDEWPGDRAALDRDEIQKMSAYADFEAHARFHPILTRCDDATKYSEICNCRPEVEELSGQACSHFSFPNAEYTQSEIDIVRQCGYKTARTADWGWMHANNDRFLLKAIHVPDDASIPVFLGQLCGAGEILKFVGGWQRKFSSAVKFGRAKQKTPNSGGSFS